MRNEGERAAGVEDTTEESYGYDGLSRLTRAQDNDALVNLKYTSLGRIKEETQNGKNVLYTYTSDGLRNSIKYPGGSKGSRLDGLLPKSNKY